MQEETFGSSFSEATRSACETEGPSAESAMCVVQQNADQPSCAQDAGVAAVVSVDVESLVSLEETEPLASMLGCGGNANGGDDLGSDGSPPDFAAHFRWLSKKARKSNRYPLHVLSKIAEKTGLSLEEMPLTVDFIQEQIEGYGLHGRPLTFARQILICLDRLVKAHPILQALKYETVEDRRVILLREAEWPISFRRDLHGWKQSVPVKVPGAENAIGSLTARTIKGYSAAVVSALSALRLSGVRFSDDCGMHFLMRVPAVKIWESFLSERQKPKTVQAALAAALRVARDMRLDQSCVDFLEARLTAIMTSTETDTARLADLAEPENYLALIEVPELLMLKAEDPNRHMFSRLSAGRSAVAFQLMWEHPDLSEQFVAQFNVEAHLRGAGSELSLLRSEDGRPEQLAPATAQLISRLLKVNELLSVPSSYLLPGRHGQLRSTGSAMQLVYHQIQGTLFRHVTRSDLRDLNTFIALSADDADLGSIAAGAGYKNSKALSLRLGHSAGRPKQERNK